MNAVYNYLLFRVSFPTLAMLKSIPKYINLPLSEYMENYTKWSETNS
jgi:hypothetical protein